MQISLNLERKRTHSGKNKTAGNGGTLDSVVVVCCCLLLFVVVVCFLILSSVSLSSNLRATPHPNLMNYLGITRRRTGTHDDYGIVSTFYQKGSLKEMLRTHILVRNASLRDNNCFLCQRPSVGPLLCFFFFIE
jgi:hypothetical protein